MTYNFAGVVWDMDGTLIDTESIHEATFKATCEKYGFKKFPPHHHIGLCFNQTWTAIGGEEQLKVTFDEFVEELHLEFMNRAKLQGDYLRPGIRTVLCKLSDAKVLQACATNSQRKAVDFNMANTGIGHYFQHMISRDDVTLGKPAPEIYLKACHSLNLNPLECLAVEDTPIGIQAAKAAGMTAIAFPHQATKDLDFSQADLVIEEISSLLDFLGAKTAA